MDTLNIVRVIKKISVNEIRNFVFENFFKRIGFSKENSFYCLKRLKRKDLLLLANKLKEKVPDPHNAKQHYQLFVRRKSRKSVKPSKIKTFENPNLVDIKSIITEHPKASHKLSKTIRQAGKVGSNSSSYSDTRKVKTF